MMGANARPAGEGSGARPATSGRGGIISSRVWPSILIAGGLLLATARAGFAQSSAQKPFNVPAADAAVSLGQIAQQADAQIVFLPETVHGVTTQAVIGRYSVPEALDRLVAGTDLIVTEDRPTGAFAVSRRPRPAEAPEDHALQMRSYIVATMQIEKHPWRYALSGGIELLSRAPDFETDWILHSVQRGLWVQDRLIPPDLAPPPTVLPALIVDDVDRPTTTKQELHSQPLNFQMAPDAWAWGGINPVLGYGQIEARDDDAYSKNINVFHSDTRGVLTDSGWAFRQRLRRCVPPLPEWFVVGLVGPFGLSRESFAFFPKAEERAVGNILMFGSGSLVGELEKQPIGKIVGPGSLWLSEADTARIKEQWQLPVSSKVPFLPAAELFGETPPREEDTALWASEAGLFVRWAVVGPGQATAGGRAAFARLLRLARSEPVTESVFSSCYGFGFADLEAKLQSYLKTVLGRPVRLSANFDDHPLGLEEPTLEQATPDQVGRILGDWLRMKGELLRESDPTLSKEFFDAAGRILVRTVMNGGEGSADGRVATSRRALELAVKWILAGAQPVHDRDFVAVFGLYENDVGDSVAARRLLETAWAAGPLRPQAYLVLGRLRLAEALASAGTNPGRLSGPQTDWIVAPLVAGRHQSPVRPEIYQLLAETWARSDGSLSAEDRAVLDESASLFPRDVALGCKLALALAHHRLVEPARAAIERVERFSPADSALRSDLENLRATFSRTQPNPSPGPNR